MKNERSIEALKTLLHAGPCLFVIGGLTGAGKSTLAKALGKGLGIPVFHSDILRKELAGLDPLTEAGGLWEHGIYQPAHRDRVYRELATRASERLTTESVIIDATVRLRTRRAQLKAVAQTHSAPIIFIECIAPTPTLRARLRARRLADATGSDATAAHLSTMRDTSEPMDELPEEEYLRLHTDRSSAVIMNELVPALIDRITRQRKGSR